MRKLFVGILYKKVTNIWKHIVYLASREYDYDYDTEPSESGDSNLFHKKYFFPVRF